MSSAMSVFKVKYAMVLVALLPKGFISVQGPEGRPAWVHAASLQISLNNSRIVPALHSAGEHSRRMALASALARQHVDLGLRPGKKVPHKS